MRWRKISGNSPNGGMTEELLTVTLNPIQTIKHNHLLFAGRPTEIPEEHVYVCESKYHEVEKNIRKLSKGLKVGTACLKGNKSIER